MIILKKSLNKIWTTKSNKAKNKRIEMNELSDIEKQNILLLKRNEELRRKVIALEQEIALLNHEKKIKNNRFITDFVPKNVNGCV